MCRPHRRGQAFPANIAQRQESRVSGIEHCDKVSREELRWKDLAGNLIWAASYTARSAQPAWHLQRIEHFTIESARFFRPEGQSGFHFGGPRLRAGCALRIDTHPVQPRL